MGHSTYLACVKSWVPCPVPHKRETEEERINIYANNIPASKYTKQISTDLKREIDGDTKIAEDSSLSFSVTLSIILTENELETKDFLTNNTMHIVLRQTISFRIDHMLSHSTSIRNLRKLKPYPVSSNHNVKNLDDNTRRKSRRFTNM